MLGDLILLADCCFGSWPRALTFRTRRKKLCKKLSQMIDMFLTAHYGVAKNKPFHQQYNKYVNEQAKKLKSEKFENRKMKLFQRIMQNIGVQVNIISRSPEITDVELMGNIVKHEKDLDIASHSSQLRLDLDHAREQLRRMSVSSIEI